MKLVFPKSPHYMQMHNTHHTWNPGVEHVSLEP
jgi:hypothetical protein